MEIRKAKAFLALAEELHFGRAAARIHMAQPPLSRLIRSLEDELGAQLFERTPRTVALTTVGAALVEPARELIMQSERMTELARSIQRGETGRVRLGFAGASLHRTVSSLVRRVRAQHGELTVELHGSQLSHPGMEKLRAGALDALIGRWDFLPRDIDSVVLAREELVVALPAGHRFVDADTVSAADVAGEPWVVLPGGSGATLSTRLHRLAARGRFVPRIVETAADSATQLLMVDAGAGIALTFSGVQENIPAHAVVFRPLSPSLGPVEVRLAWRRAGMGPALATFVDVATEQYPAGIDAP